MFEYQTAISRADRPAGLQRVGLRGPERGRRRGATWRSWRTARPRVLVSRGVHPHRRETLAHARRGLRHGGRGGPAARRRHRPRRAGRGASTTTPRRVFLQQPNFLGAVEDLGALGRGRQADRRAVDRARATRSRSGSSSRPASAASTSPSARARRSATGSTSAARRSASSPPPRSTCAGCPGGSRARRATSTAGAASCSRSRRASSTSAARRRRTTSAPRRRSTRSPASIYLTWLGRRGLVELGELLLRAHRLRARGAGGARRRRGAARAAGRARVRACALDATGRARDRALRRRRGSTPATALGATTPSTPTACSSRSPSSARARTSTGSPTRSGARSPPSAEAGWRHERGSGRDAAAARQPIDDLREGRAPGRRAFAPPAARRARGAGRGAAARRACAAASRRALPEVTEPEIVRHYNGSPSGTSTSTPASTRSARAR